MQQPKPMRSPGSNSTDSSSAISIYYDDIMYDSLNRPKEIQKIHITNGYAGSISSTSSTTNNTFYDDSIDKRTLEIKKELAFLEKEELEAKEKSKRKCCCCFPRNKVGKIACMVTFGLILTIIGVVLFLFVPRMPDFQLAALETQGSNPFTLIKNPGDEGNYTMNLNLILTVRLIHKNYYPFHVNDITIKVFIFIIERI